MKIIYDKEACELIEDFINSQPISLNSYCEKKGIYSCQFKKNLNFVKAEHQELYIKYILSLENIKQAHLNEVYQKKVNELKRRVNSSKENLDKQEQFYCLLINLLSSEELEHENIIQTVGEHLQYKQCRIFLFTVPEIKKVFDNAFYKQFLLNDEEMVTTAKAVISKIRLGVIKNNEIRDFNLLDYSLMTDIPISVLAPTMKSIGVMNTRDIQKLSFLLDQYKKCLKAPDEQHHFEDIMNCNIYNGEEYLLADQNDKEKIIQFLNNNNITLKYYKLALYAYINGEIDLNRVYAKEIPSNIKSKAKKANLNAIKEILELKQKSEIYLKYQREFQDSSIKYKETLVKR